MNNNDSSFCSIILYNKQKAAENVMKDIAIQWKDKVVKKLSKANSKPGTILTEQLWDGWASTLAIGNFYFKMKKCIVMLNSFRKGDTTVCAVFAFSDKIFKGPIEQFSKNLHLINQ
jgi:hypothetical protein